VQLDDKHVRLRLLLLTVAVVTREEQAGCSTRWDARENMEE
jgi:hypothetical protein